MTTNPSLHSLRKSIGARMHEERLRREVTLEKLSRLTRISPHKLDWYEMGKGAVNLEILAIISRALGIGIDGLLPLP